MSGLIPHQSWIDEAEKFHSCTIPKLKSCGLKMGEHANNGCEIARKIIGYYSLLAASFDPFTYYLMCEEIKKWEDKYLAWGDSESDGFRSYK